MKKATLMLVLTMAGSLAASAQDFASRFMMEFSKDTTIHCQTISPKMMEKLVNVHRKNNERAEARQLIAKLKSARIIQGADKPKYFLHAEKMLKHNRQRFIPLNQSTARGNNQIFVRRKEDFIIELIMLNKDSAAGTFTIVNLTGDMDDEFIRVLSGNK